MILLSPFQLRIFHGDSIPLLGLAMQFFTQQRVHLSTAGADSSSKGMLWEMVSKALIKFK